MKSTLHGACVSILIYSYILVDAPSYTGSERESEIVLQHIIVDDTMQHTYAYLTLLCDAQSTRDIVALDISLYDTILFGDY